ncbi:MAG: hypothetical protein H7175_06270 [Burkholderiales bacterium]|nr:hypothetical protein [Anaerolineae bacterium]
MLNHTQKHWLIGVMLLLMLTASGGLTIAQDAQSCGTDSGEGCAPDSARVDLTPPSFSNPTNITNPLFPISSLSRVLLFGTVDRLPFRTETTLLPDTRIIEWNGQQIEVLASQYMAFLDNRVQEVAIDWYAQSDDGSVWYLGEDVFDYEDGVVISTEGTWLAGRDGPAAMIMPGNPQVGDVYRPENSPGFVFEEVTVTSISAAVHGPLGIVEGAIVTEELHMDGTLEDKIFAPGYGEFFTGNRGELEALALALPVDALNMPPPAELETLLSGANAVFAAAESEDWNAASATLHTMIAAWDTYQTSNLPRMLDARMSWALVELVGAVDARQTLESRQSAIHVARASLDFQLRHRSVVEIDFALFDLWAAQILVDVAADDAGGITSDVTTLEWVWDRIVHALDDANAALVVAHLDALRVAADDEDLAAASEAALRLRETLSEVAPAT